MKLFFTPSICISSVLITNIMKLLALVEIIYLTHNNNVSIAAKLFYHKVHMYNMCIGNIFYQTSNFRSVSPTVSFFKQTV